MELAGSAPRRLDLALRLITPLDHPRPTPIIDPFPRIHSPCSLIRRTADEKVRGADNVTQNI